MSSEAARKAYPEEEYGRFHDFGRGDLLEAFDRGAVEALRQAAKDNYLAHGVPVVAVSDLLKLADEWVVGQ